MTNSLVRSNDDNTSDLFSPRGPMDENQHPNNENIMSWPPDRDSHYKLKLLQQQLLQQQEAVVVSSSSSTSSMYEHYLPSSIHDNSAGSSTTTTSSYSSHSSPLMVLAAAAAATATMDHSISSVLDFSSTTMQHHPFDDDTNSSDPINKRMTGMVATDGGTATPSCTTDVAHERKAPLSMTSSSLSPYYFPYPHYDTTNSPMNSSVPAVRLACLAAVSSHARNAAATDTPCRRTESMLMDEQKCLLAMSSVPPFAHPLFATTNTTPSSSSSQEAGSSVIPVHDDAAESRFNVRWNEEEDFRLKQAIELEGHAWALIATKYFGNTRNKHQCKSRWTKQVDPSLTRVAWTNEEDETIIRLQAQGKGWPEIAHELPGRIAVQINDRFTNHIDPTLINKLPFTTEEKAMLMKTVAQYGEPKNWKEIARVFFPGRSALQVKNCWHNAKKKSKKKGRASLRESTTATTTTSVLANVDNAIPAPFLVPDSAKAPSTITRSRSRAATAISSSPLFQLPVGNTKSHSSSTPSVAKVEHVVSAVSLNATSAKTSTGGRSRSRSKDAARKPTMAVSSPKRSHSFVRWSMREDTILKQAIEMEGPAWEAIAVKYFGKTRSDEQCKNRWTKHLDPALKIGSWTKEEDATISRGKEQGMSFATIACELPGRIAESVRNRYKNHLDPSLNKAKFTEEEKTIIMQVAARYGEPKNWALVAKHVPGRSVLQIKNYWHNTTKRSGGVVQKSKKKTTKDRQARSGSSPAAKGKKANQQHQQVDRDDLTNRY